MLWAQHRGHRTRFFGPNACQPLDLAWHIRPWRLLSGIATKYDGFEELSGRFRDPKFRFGAFLPSEASPSPMLPGTTPNRPESSPCTLAVLR